MFGTIRKHQTGLWVVIAALTILSFVIFGPTNTRMGDAFRSGSSFGMIGGRPVSQDQVRNAIHEVELDYFLKNQQWPNSESTEVMREAYIHLFLIQKIKDFGITVSDEAAGAMAHRMLGSASLDEFTDKILKPVNMDATDFDRFLRHTLGIQQLGMTVGVAGRLVTPQEAETMYKLENQDIQTSLVYFSASNYMSEVPIITEAVEQFYTNQLANYRIPERVEVSYVKFNITNYFSTAKTALTNLDQMVDANVERLGTNLFNGTKTPEESKAAIRDELIRQHAFGDAHHAALDFANEIDAITNHTLEAFNAQAAAKNMTVRVTAPFDREYGPTDIVVPGPFTQKAFSLSDDDRFGGPIQAADGFYVIAFQQRLPAETPTFAKIQDKVTADYRYMNALQMAQQEAMKFDVTLTNGLDAGKSFASICSQARVKPQPLPPFSLSIRSLPEILEDKISLGMLKQAAFSTAPGKVSPLAGARDGAFLIYVEKQLPLDEAKMKTAMPEFLAYLRSARENDAFNQWLNTEIRQDPDLVQYLQHLMEESQTKSSARRKS